MSRVSIIIPAHNSASWIEATLSSAGSQTFQNIEIIVVDDGSTDATSKAVERFPDPRIQLVRQTRLGAAAARNHGLRKCTGDFIQFLDSDDLLSPNKIAHQVEALSNAGPRSIASCSWAHFTGDVSSAAVVPERVWTVSDPIDWLVSSLSGGGMMQPACWLTPRSITESAGPWNEALSLHDDGEYFARVLLNADENVFVPEAVVFYRNVPLSLSRRRSRGAAESALSVCKARHQLLLEKRDDEVVRKAIATQYLQFAYEFASVEPSLAAAAEHAIASLGVEPHATVGANSFRTLTRAIGFRAALGLRRMTSAAFSRSGT